jgi:pyruvate/2-oxoglutarate/acetoin dehydrogenase E1 component
MPMVIRMPYGGGVRAPELHEDSPEAYYAHAPGIKVAMPSTAADAKGLITAAIRDPDPVVVLEPKALYRASAEPVPDGEHFVELGRAVVARHGTDATVISYGAMLPVATAAAEQLAERDEAEVEVLDLRTLTPLDEDAVLDSVAKTGRAVIVHEAPRTAGFGAEVAALLAERGILDLRAPVRRVTGYDVPYPYWSLEDSYIPSIERVVRALEEVLRF